jgi:hypothetical protein
MQNLFFDNNLNHERESKIKKENKSELNCIPHCFSNEELTNANTLSFTTSDFNKFPYDQIKVPSISG